MTDSTSINGDVIKGYLFSATAALFTSGELVSFGHPGMDQTANIIAWLDVNGETDFATYTPGHTRDENVTITFLVSCWQGGSNVAEKVVSDLAYGYVRQIERLVRVTDPTLGGNCLWAFLSGHSSLGTTDPAQLAAGRFIEVTGTITARVRIRN